MTLNIFKKNVDALNKDYRNGVKTKIEMLVAIDSMIKEMIQDELNVAEAIMNTVGRKSIKIEPSYSCCMEDCPDHDPEISFGVFCPSCEKERENQNDS